MISTTDVSVPISSGTQYMEIALICFLDDEDESLNLPYSVTGSLVITSVVFLILTLIVYAVVPELR